MFELLGGVLVLLAALWLLSKRNKPTKRTPEQGGKVASPKRTIIIPGDRNSDWPLKPKDRVLGPYDKPEEDEP